MSFAIRLAVLVLVSIVAMGSAPSAFAQQPSGTPYGTGGEAPSTSPGEVGPGGFTRGSGASPGLTEEFAQGMRPAIPSASLSGPVDANTYRVGPGDVMQLLLWGKVSRALVLEVGPEGHVLLPGAGTVIVAGHTLADVKADVLQRMRREFRDVQMDLRLVRPRVFRIYISGMVRSAGPAEANGTHHVFDLLTPGLFQDGASRRRIEVRHRDGTQEYADLDLFLRTGEATFNPSLRDGDVVHVPVATEFIHAEGAMARPGRIELGVGDSLLTLFRLAGDPVPAADAQRALLVRWRLPFQPESLWFGLSQAYTREVNPELRDGDRLYVYYIPQYHLQHQVTILGEVGRPGVYPIVEGRHRLTDLVTAAGGFLPAADLSAIRLHRRSTYVQEKDPELDRLLRLSKAELTTSEYEVLRTRLSGLREDFRVDWNRLTTSNEDLDLLLRDGDVVRVERLVSSIRVDGEVRRPGIMAYSQGQRVGDYIRQAGGYTDRAWRSKVRVTRAVTGQTLLARNVRSLDPGDLVWVPDRSDRTLWDNTRDLLTALSQIATIIIAIRSVN